MKWTDKVNKFLAKQWYRHPFLSASLPAWLAVNGATELLLGPWAVIVSAIGSGAALFNPSMTDRISDIGDDTLDKYYPPGQPPPDNKDPRGVPDTGTSQQTDHSPSTEREPPGPNDPAGTPYPPGTPGAQPRDPPSSARPGRPEGGTRKRPDPKSRLQDRLDAPGDSASQDIAKRMGLAVGREDGVNNGYQRIMTVIRNVAARELLTPEERETIQKVAAAKKFLDAVTELNSDKTNLDAWRTAFDAVETLGLRVTEQGADSATMGLNADLTGRFEGHGHDQ